MVVAISKALENNSKTIICASTGNTSASAAAYGACFGLTTLVLVPKGDVALGKLAQAIAYGAKRLALDGTFDRALEIVRALSSDHPITLVNSVNPYRLEGQETAAFEIADELGDSPDLLFIPVGNAGNITAYWKGFNEYYALNHTSRLPQMMGFQASGAAPIVIGKPVPNPSTLASAIRIGNPANWEGALNARDQSHGSIDTVSDDEIMEAYGMLARREGIFCEPASAASLAGLIKLRRQNIDLSDKQIVCVITGNGLKDSDLVHQQKSNPIREVADNPQDIDKLLSEIVGATSPT
jgi:threonine synthase